MFLFKEKERNLAANRENKFYKTKLLKRRKMPFEDQTYDKFRCEKKEQKKAKQNGGNGFDTTSKLSDYSTRRMHLNYSFSTNRKNNFEKKNPVYFKSTNQISFEL